MTLGGTAFLAMWHDIARGAEDEYVEWHTREHMPERLSIPGFVTGKRLHSPGTARHAIGTIYSGESLDVFRSSDYLERLNNPTPWTASVAPSFQNFLRVACEKIASAGLGDGGSMATIRLTLAGDDAEAVLLGSAQPLAEAILAIGGVCGVHVGLARAEVSGIRTRETELRKEMNEAGFDVVLLVEGASSPGLRSALPQAEQMALATGFLKTPVSAVYEAAFTLTSGNMRASA